ncbi:MAG: hypothetical protein FJY92_00225, partial [Candidatus Hydrogenedentes bacterium]|nr:hypothetical protein [Candidatus Hydrogenedentota bacterium]
MTATEATNPVVVPDRMGPTRGVVFVRNARGARVQAPDLERWLRLVRTVFKCDRVDAIARGEDLGVLRGLRAAADELDLRISLRTDCADAPPAADALRAANLWDVLLCPARADALELDAWLRVCEQAGLAVRVQLVAPFDRDLDAARAVERLARACVVNIAADDPFTDAPPARSALHSASSVQQAAVLARAIAARGIEVNLVRFPFCAFD